MIPTCSTISAVRRLSLRNGLSISLRKSTPTWRARSAPPRITRAGRLKTLLTCNRRSQSSQTMQPYTSNVHLALGDVFAAEGNWSAAVAQFRMESKLRPASADAFYSLGSVLLQQGQASGAVEELASADRLRPDTPQILLALGKAAFAANDAARAEASWIKLLGIDKESDLAASAHLELATLYRRGGRSQEADREMAAYEQSKKPGGH